MPATNTIPAALEAARAYAASLDAVASAEIWVPTPEEVAEYAEDGIVAAPTLDVTVWRSERNPSMIRSVIISQPGIEYSGEGSSEVGPIFSFRASAA